MQDLRSLFLIREDITYLNFGSFGACPRPIFNRYQQYQLELEAEAVQFITVTGPKYLEASRKALATYINCSPDDLVYVTNPSYAVNIVAKNFPLQEGDEVLATDIEYGACDRTWNYYCRKAGATYRRQPIRFPLQDEEDFLAQFFAGLTSRTRLIFISHLTSATGLRLPVEAVCRRAAAEGIPVFIDGAHAPGQVPLDLQAVGAQLYTGACHKWMMTPKGSSFLWVHPSLQHLMDPLVVSWGYEAAQPSHSRFLDYHQMQGTRDFSAFLTIPDALAFMESHNWPARATYYRALTQAAAPRFCQLLHAEPLAPVNDAFIGQLYSTRIRTPNPEGLQRLLYENYKIEIPVMRQNSDVYLRYSLNAFNREEDLDLLADALTDIKKTTNLIEA